MNKVNSSSMIRTKDMTKIGMLSVIGFVLMYFQLPLTFVAPPFMKLDISDLPVLIGAFTMGPVFGIIIAALKNILALVFKGTMTAGIGELSNFIISATFAFVSSFLYKRHKTYKGAIFSLTIGVLAMTTLAMISNYFVVFPLYAKVMPMDAIIAMGSAITSKITGLFSMMIYSVLPFNLIKGFTTSAVMMLVYKKVSPIFKK
ncbi:MULTISPECIES: ECF transporter S component [Peptoniphilus]|uniref:ECF transporter S component n=1 Tax=Peptoniphilus TaxID=162289 RepID=UPI000288AA81|nr:MULTISPECIES: ECF transporter S component [Peptoniphilus]MBS6610730.1 ECF transporter S component [Peptoniphilus harei]MDU2115104.1 ECF transporter S component [Peptoniphilus lacydonensis]MDU5376961.1 ECF transporter S component [Peptoniphilus lacydonensis]MDU5436372.1 ECF transporter S component [Peptoniphilus lacydonensis]MDU5595159.1 ECF transporter S component [Peptoniphilus rhinitidis]